MPPSENLETIILQKIAHPRENGKSNTRWVIITELAYELCVKLKREGVTPDNVAEKSRHHVESCETTFLKLAAEKKIELNLQTGEVKLVELGERISEELKPKTGPA